MARWILVAIAMLTFRASPVSAQYIGIFMDPSAASCAGQVGEHPWVDLHVVAVLEGAVTRLAGAQFRITGAPESWSSQTVLWVPNPEGGISLGHPLFPNPLHPLTAGVDVAFSTCQSGGHVELGRVVILGALTPGNVHLRVEGFQLVQADPRCPFVVDCDIPYYSKVCVGGGEIVLNGPVPSKCQMAVDSRTWSSVKSLYQ